MRILLSTHTAVVATAGLAAGAIVHVCGSRMTTPGGDVLPGVTVSADLVDEAGLPWARRGNTVVLAGDFAASVSGVVDPAAYPGAELVFLATANESLVDATDAGDARSFVLEMMGGSRRGFLSPQGDYGPMELSAGDYYLEVWSHDASGVPTRLYSEIHTVASGAQTIDLD